jgi:hypothetical protein
MQWVLEIGTVLQGVNGNTWGPFCRKTCSLEELPTLVQQEMIRLAEYLQKTVEAESRVERLVYLRTRVLSLHGPLKNVFETASLPLVPPTIP